MKREPDCHRLFFALMPPADLRAELAWLRDNNMQGRAEADDRLHVTMFLFDQSKEFQPTVAERIQQILAGQELPSCPVLFDQLVRASGSTLLLPSDKLPGILRLQNRLAELLGAANLYPKSGWRFNPHMTLRRGRAHGETLAIDSVSWVADEILLLDSLVGLTQYNVIGRWPLSAIEK